ncbi:MAG TPA: NAD(P)H-dependent oxidoreductase subunit E [Beijerinckiaceae bacterium]|jgi:formate dehydrogenase subunit gamma
MSAGSGQAGWNAAEAERIVDAQIAEARAFFGADAEGATPLLPILHALQAAFGHVPPDAQPLVARKLNISQAEVRGVVSFYHDFHTQPRGRRTLKLCGAEACQSMGGERLAAHLAQRHALAPGATSPDGALSVETVYCLGGCAAAPTAMLDDRLVCRLDETRLDALVMEARR